MPSPCVFLEVQPDLAADASGSDELDHTGPTRRFPIPATLPLAEAIWRADEINARVLIVMDHENTLIAIVNESAVMTAPAQRRPWIEAGTLARKLYLFVEPTGQVCGLLVASDLDGFGGLGMSRAPLTCLAGTIPGVAARWRPVNSVVQLKVPWPLLADFTLAHVRVADAEAAEDIFS